ncbi:triple tyrosine motif-containing protein [Clostridium sp. BL-8]|uniref:triple tyrosine motif-containing protein n=1 Tax=Clostridium sp. BL-8 TaxID=349938 RepID=UPI00098CB6B4|nr:triple tyrosine motif-containing protein [Clostridium sp. BL-8]OOM79690.1 hypothetical protein CLOBL_14490 [Clostridium sp. BL-8]
MEELQLKYVEIIFDKQTPQNIGTEINISSRIDDCDGKLEYKFIVGKGGIWNTIQEFSENSKCVWKPRTEGEYMVMVQARDKDGKKPLDYLAREEFSITNDEATDAMLNEEILSKVANDEEGDISFRGIVEDEISSDNLEFKEAVNNDQESNVVFLEVKELSKEEKETLIGEKSINEELLFSEGTERRECKKIDFEGNEEKEVELINTIITDKEEYMVGEKCSIEVKMNNEGAYLYRFYIKNNDEWDIIRDYDTSNLLKYTVNEEGEKKFLVQCKMMQSTEAFEDYKIVRINVKSIRKIEITDFKCLNKALISGEKLGFVVETNVYKNEAEKDKVVLLYKFYKLYKDGKSVCIQDYSTRNDVYYKELEAGSYRILCLVKSIFSNREYDDRAILVYDVKPYEDIKINSFVASLNSPQTTETDIRFTSEIQGGKNLLYKYKVKGPIEEDTGFTAEKEFSWKPIEAGEYEIILYVKDSEYKGEYEATKKIAFTIEEKGKKPVKILDVIVDREKKVIAGESVNIMVNGEGGTRLQYAFTIRENKKKLEGVSYNKSNWINFIPEHAGEYEVEIMVKDQYSDKPYDANTFVHLKAMEYLPGEIDYIILPYKETHLIGEAIEFECIIQNTQDVLVKYETKINGHSVEETEFSKNKKLRFVPKIAGKYTIEVYAKNIKCKDEYDSKKQINLYVSEAPPVIETKIITNKLEFNINEEVTFEAISRGGKDVCYEFYLMVNNEWKKVQPYSKKHYYSFIPFAEGKYKILALAKSYYKKVSYEDYDQITFFVKAQ